jgi:hypothetical protein
MNKDEKKRADQALRFLIMLRDVAEADGNHERAEMIGDLFCALTTGADHPVLTRWLGMQSDSELAQQHNEYLTEWKNDQRVKHYLQMLDGLIKE